MNIKLYEGHLKIEDESILKVIKLYIIKKIESAKFSESNVDEEEVKLELQKLQLLDWKDRLVFHGGCLECSTPIHETVSTCLSCEYCRGFGKGFEDKSGKYSNVEA